jgi:acetolactate synthase I/II/III large subunit
MASYSCGTLPHLNVRRRQAGSVVKSSRHGRRVDLAVLVSCSQQGVLACGIAVIGPTGERRDVRVVRRRAIVEHRVDEKEAMESDMKGFEIVASALADEHVGILFGLAGDGNLYLIDDLVRARGVRYVGAAHEASAVMMAIGFAKARDEVGVATTTHGPGMTNTFTALVEGVRSRCPIVVLIGDTDPQRLDHGQDIDQRAIVSATGAGFELVRSLAAAPEDVNRALWRARTEQRPIVLNLPVALNWAEGDYEPFRRARPVQQALAPDPDALDEAVGLIASSKRPIVLAGRGAVAARASLLALANTLGAPVATTVQATGLFRGEPYDLGIFGTLSHPVASKAIAQADCVVAFGASLNFWTTDNGAVLKGKRVVQCDLTPSRFGPIPRCDVGLLGDSARTADAILDWLKVVGRAPSMFRENFRAALSARAWVNDYTDRGTNGTVDPRVLTAALDESLPHDRTLVIDAGRFMHYALTVCVPEPTALVTTHGFGSIGLGAGAAVGAGVARPDRTVVLMAGDGGFMMGGFADFQAAVRSGVDLIAVIYNDGGYGAEYVQFYRKGMDPSLAVNSWPDLSSVAVAMGGEGVTVQSNADLAKLTHRIEARSGPMLIDARIDPEVMSALQM